jgi:hypothetical protein
MSWRDFGATNASRSCLWCGCTLRPYDAKTETVETEAWRPPASCPSGVYETCGSRKFLPDPERGPMWFRCVKCGEASTGERKRVRTSHAPATRFGSYGDGFFCGLRCAYDFGLAFAKMGRRLAPKVDADV